MGLTAKELTELAWPFVKTGLTEWAIETTLGDEFDADLNAQTLRFDLAQNEAWQSATSAKSKLDQLIKLAKIFGISTGRAEQLIAVSESHTEQMTASLAATGVQYDSASETLTFDYHLLSNTFEDEQVTDFTLRTLGAALVIGVSVYAIFSSDN